MSRLSSRRRSSLWRMSQEEDIAAGRHDFAADFHSSAAAAAIAAPAEIDSGGVDSPKNATEGDAVGVVDTNDDTKDEAFDSIMLPESTHTLLFTEPIKSNAFEFSVTIAGMSILCLFLALMNNGITNGNARIPANVGVAVKVAQFASIFIALLMEEEIPTGLYLLRRIPKQYFESKFPELKYYKFVWSCMLRIFMGYLFLVNVLLILMQASNVMDIFFDFIALQFLQQLDDIAFNLARMGVFSKSLMEATTNKYFRAEFKKRTEFGRSLRRISIFLKTIYFLNLVGLLCGQVYVTVKQARGDYQCKSITVIYKGEVWEESVVRKPGKETEEMVLIYTYFNGVYEQDGTSHDGRPVYVEQNKFDSTPFDTTSPDPENIEVKVPAKILYCKSIRAWVFMHEYIRKSIRDDSDCPWLLRSEETEVFDIEEVQGPWQVWAGVISRTDVDIVCNECKEDGDCNLNGVCKKDGKCECFHDVAGVTFLGSHCEVRLKDECRTIYGEYYNDSWSVLPLVWGEGFLQEYDRPVYVYQEGNPMIDDSDALFLIYSGDRWFGVYQGGGQFLLSEGFQEYLRAAVTNYHAFWDKAYQTDTIVVSDPTTKDTPVGVDFYFIGERGDQFGPYGALYPLQLHNQTGRGVFRCTESNLNLNVWGKFANATRPGRKLQKEGLFDNYLRLGESN